MNIDEIRDEIPKAFDLFGIGGNDLAAGKAITISFVEQAYEAGIKRGGEISISALNEVELRENPIYQKGYKAGKAADFEDHCDAIEESRQKWFETGYEEAAKDPKAWYVLDKNGEHVHIGDTVKSGDTVKEITGLGNDELFSHWWSGSPASSFEKVIPDTRDKIKDELAECLSRPCGGMKEGYEKIAEQFISRIEALGDQ